MTQRVLAVGLAMFGRCAVITAFENAKSTHHWAANARFLQKSQAVPSIADRTASQQTIYISN